MDRFACLLGAEDPSILDPRILWLTGLLVATLLLGAMILSWLDRWRKRQLSDDRPGDQLTSFRALYEAGEISREEYERIRSRVARGESAGPVPTRPAANPGVGTIERRPVPPAPPAPSDPTPPPPSE